MSLDAVAADGVYIPRELLPSVARHRRHLASLAEELRAAGMDDTLIDHSVRMLIDSYRAELTAAIHIMIQEAANGR